jgi:uncharacterized membrane protein YkoI
VINCRILVVAGLLATAATSALLAETRIGSAQPRKGDHEEARRAFQSGEARSLGDILAQLRSQTAGEVIEVELKRKRGGYIYEFKLLSADGRVAEVELDAKTGRLIEKGRD